MLRIKSHNIFFAIISILLIMLGVLSIWLFNNAYELERHEKLRHNLFVLADELKQSSDDLTRYCRTYALTGNRIWENKYWEVLAIRNGKRPRPNGRTIALQDSLQKLGITNDELDKLKDAEKKSNELVWTEKVCFNAMKGLFADTVNEFSFKGVPDTLFAQGIMFNKKYHDDKEMIMNPIAEFYVMLDQRTKNNVAVYKKKNNRILMAIIGMIILIAGLSFYAIFVLRRRILSQLKELKETNLLISKNEEELKQQNVELDTKVEERNLELNNQNKEYLILIEELKENQEELLAAEEELRANNEELIEKNEELRTAEEEFRQINNQLQIGIENMPNAYIHLNDDLQVIEWNKEAEKIFGYSKQEMLGKNAVAYIVPEPDRHIVEDVMRKLKIGEVADYSAHNNNIRKDGKLISCQWLNTPIVDKDENVFGILCLVQDITQGKQVENELRESEKKFRNFVETSQDLIWKCDEKGEFTYLNPAWENVTGYKLSEMMGKPFTDFQPKEVSEKDIKEFESHLAGGQIRGHETMYFHKNGSLIHLIFNAIPLFDESNNIIGTQGTAFDITERKRAEDSLKEIRQFTDNLIKTANVMIIGLDKKGEVQIFNPMAENITGYSIDEFKKTNWFEVIVPKNKYPFVWDEYNRLMKGGLPKLFENPILTKKGKERIISWSNNKIVEDGKTIGTISFGVDITERRKAEKEIKKLSTAVEQSANSIIITNLKGIIEYVNPKFSEITGYTSKEVIGKKPNILKSGKQSDQFYKQLWQTIISGKTWQGEFLNKDKNDNLFWERATITPVKDEKDSIINFLAIKEDFTKRKIAENALLESEEKYRTIVENISDGLILINNAGEYLSVNAAYCKMHGYSLEEITNLKVADLLHEDNSKSIENYNEYIIKNSFLDEEMIGRHKNGSKVFIHVNSRVFNFNQAKAILTIVSDISERKKMEQRIFSTMLEAEEKERERYAKELHDGLGPLLSTSMIYLHTMLEEKEIETQKEYIDRTYGLLEEAVQSIREISNNLSPDILRKYGIVQAIRSFIEKLKLVTKIDFAINSNLKCRLPETEEFTIYRTIIELINNSVKYARAGKISIDIHFEDGSLKVSFSDDGKGFNYESVKDKTKGFGLMNLENRVQKLGGQYHYFSAPGKGTKVNISIQTTCI